MMWYRYVLLGFYGLCAGAVTAAGYYAVISSIGVVNRFSQYSHTAEKIRLYERMLIISAVVGTILTLFHLPPVLPAWTLGIYGIFAGAFIGCFIVSLAEAVKGIPIFARRARLKKGLQALVLALAIGKCIGSICYFFVFRL